MNNRFGGRLVNTRYIKYLVIIIIVIALGIGAKKVLSSIGSTSTNQTREKVVLKPALAYKDIGKDVAIPLKDADGEAVDSVNMRIESVELRDEIIVQGQKASSVASRAFLVVNLKFVNKLEQGVEVNTKDYLRLSDAGSEEWLAPDIHNDPVLIQAISTKPTRVAFPVDAKKRQFVLQIGEITGNKEKLDLDLTQ